MIFLQETEIQRLKQALETCEAEKGQFDGQRDVQKTPFTAEDIRFTQSKDGQRLYAILLALPKDRQVTIQSLASPSLLWAERVGSVRLVGGGKLKFTRDEQGLHITLPEKLPSPTALALRIQS